jgi:hypothetical protein
MLQARLSGKVEKSAVSLSTSATFSSTGRQHQAGKPPF